METITTEARAPINWKEGFGVPPKKIANANGMQIPIANAPKKFLINQAPQIQAIHRIGSKNDAINIARNTFINHFCSKTHQHRGLLYFSPIVATNLLVLSFVQYD